MKSKRHSSLFGLPVLLSFNELALILIFGMGLFCAHTLLKLKKDVSVPAYLAITQELEMERVKVKELTRLATMVAGTNAQAAKLAQELETERATVKEMTSVTNTVAGANAQAAKLAQELEMERVKVKELTRLATMVAGANAQAAKLAQELEKERATVKELSIEYNEVALRLRSATNGLHERGVRQELLGLKGGMTNVIILLDRSGSMKTGGRWNDALAVVNSWLRYLPVKQCALITFSDQCTSFPSAGLLPMVGSEGEANRANLIAQLQGLEPEGNTDTLSALKLAYGYNQNNKADTIILFTDGAPYVRSSGNWRTVEGVTGGTILYSKDQMKAVLELAQSEPGVPVNVVAIGNYYEERQLTEFLIKLAKETGGAFLGK